MNTAAATLARRYVEANLPGLGPVLVVRCPKRRHTIARVYRTRWGMYVWTEPIKTTPAAQREAAERGSALPSEYQEGPGLIIELPAGTTAGWRGGCGCAVYRPLQDDVLAAIAAGKRELILSEGSEWHPGVGETQWSAWEISQGTHPSVIHP